MANWKKAFTFNTVVNAIKFVLVVLSSFLSSVVLQSWLPHSSTLLRMLISLPITALLAYSWWKTRNGLPFNTFVNALKLVLVVLCSYLGDVVLRSLLPTSATFIILLLWLPFNTLLAYLWWKTS